MSKGTTHRTVRIEDGLWEEAKATAIERGDNLSNVIRDGLRTYVAAARAEKEASNDGPEA